LLLKNVLLLEIFCCTTFFVVKIKDFGVKEFFVVLKKRRQNGVKVVYHFWIWQGLNSSIENAIIRKLIKCIFERVFDTKQNSHLELLKLLSKTFLACFAELFDYLFVKNKCFLQEIYFQNNFFLTFCVYSSPKKYVEFIKCKIHIFFALFL